MQNEESEEQAQEKNSERVQTKPHLLLLRDTTIIIGLVTLMGYLVAYNYQKGYKSFYKIDDVFINDITLTQIVISIVSILGATITIFNIFPLLKNTLILNKNKEWLITRFMIKYWIVIPFLILYIINFHLGLSLVSSISIIVMYFILAILPITISSFFHEGKNYFEKLRNNIATPEASFIDLVKFNIFDSTKGFIIGLFLAFIIIGGFANIIGYSKATKKDIYYTFEYEKEVYIVVGDYDRKLIVAPYDKEKNAIVSSYQIIESNSSLEKPLKLNVTKLKDSPKIEYFQLKNQ